MFGLNQFQGLWFGPGSRSGLSTELLVVQWACDASVSQRELREPFFHVPVCKLLTGLLSPGASLAGLVIKLRACLRFPSSKMTDGVLVLEAFMKQEIQPKHSARETIREA